MAQTRRSFRFALGAVFRARGNNRPEMTLLRPPGALGEEDFLAACIRCGQCVMVCPVDALLFAGARAGVALGTPCVVPERAPCNLCQDQDIPLCIDICPTGALRPVGDLRKVRMGTAVVVEELCLAFNRVLCRSCWHACPFPDEAIRFDPMLRPVVVAAACTGCGLCTRACPTRPSAIPIRPSGREDFAADPLAGRAAPALQDWSLEDGSQEDGP